MTVSTIASIAAGIGRSLGNQNAKVATSVQSLVTGNRSNLDVASLTVANNLQSQIASLRSATQNVAQASAMVRVAEGGAGEIARTLGRLQDLTMRASSATITDAERRVLDAEFQSLRGTINRIASNTTFGDQKLLDGSLTSTALQLTGEGEEGFAVKSLTDKALFGTGEVNLLSVQNAQAAQSAVRTAQTTVTEQRATLGALAQGIEYAFASLQTASINQEASRATLSDSDFLSLSTESQQQRVQAQATAALLAQTNKLPGNILALLSE